VDIRDVVSKVLRNRKRAELVITKHGANISRVALFASLVNRITKDEQIAQATQSLLEELIDIAEILDTYDQSIVEINNFLADLIEEKLSGHQS